MRIVDVRESTAPMKSEIRNAFIDFSQMTISLVAVVTDAVRNGRPVVGYGFMSNGRYAQGGVLRERIIPRIMRAAPETLLDETGANLDPVKVWAAMMTNEKPGGHGERAHAVGAVDMAVWDAVAKALDQPLWKLLAERFNGGKHDEKVMIYPGGGYYYPGKGLEQLKDEMRGYREAGYRTVKMKIGGADLATDMRRIEAVIEVTGSGEEVAVDANGRFDLETAIDYARAMQDYGLFWYEEPGDPLDYALQAELAEHYEPPMATGENLFSLIDARNLIRYAGLRPDRDWLQFDAVLAYGLTEYLRIVEIVEAAGWSRRRLIPHGGQQLNLHLAAGLQLGGAEAYPGVFQPYGFAGSVPVEDGHAVMGDAPGIGVETKPDLYALLKPLAEG